MRFRSCWGIGLATLLFGCTETKTGFVPELGVEDSAAAKERFARRLYLDLTGLPATAEETEAVLAALTEQGNTPETRGALAETLVRSPAFGKLHLSEVENAALGGQTLAGGYDLVCNIIRGTDTACFTCEDIDACACPCASLAVIGDERQALTDLGEAFFAGQVSSSELERAVAASQPFAFNGTSPEGISMQLFQVFLGRPAEADEQKNARFMTIGAIAAGSPAGLLFHRHGANYEDLLDIVFESEVYRDALVTRVFGRYLGRRPSPDEMRFFSAALDPAHPDVRSVVRAVVSSGEYYQQ